MPSLSYQPNPIAIWPGSSPLPGPIPNAVMTTTNKNAVQMETALDVQLGTLADAINRIEQDRRNDPCTHY